MQLDNPLTPFLEAEGTVVLDGGLATELERRGMDLRDPLWSAKVLTEAPELIRQVHYDYFAAGADVATSASYQATFEGFARRGIDAADAESLMRLSVALSRQARDDFWSDPAHRHGRRQPLVAASIGPYGAMRADGSEYRGDYGLSVDQLMAFHQARMAVLASSGADLLACETIPSYAEAEALLRLLPQFPYARAWLAFSCGDGSRVCHGEPLAQCVALAGRCEQVVAVGVNCTAPRHVAELLRHAAGATSKPLLAYPNSGEVWDAGARRWRPGDDDDATGDKFPARQWYDAGARLIGGCCRTTPDHIRAIAARFRKPG